MQILEETATLLETQPLMPTTKDASLPEIQDVKTEPEAPLHWIWTLVAMIFTLGIPAFHASLATITSGTMIGESIYYLYATSLLNGTQI